MVGLNPLVDSGVIILSYVSPDNTNWFKVVGIGENAFNGCAALPSIVIPDSVTVLGDSAFNCCNALFAVTFNDPYQLTSVSTNNLFTANPATANYFRNR